uniref:N-terminal E2 ubiquitin-conjugating enzyme n=1 Tax=Cyprinus carpio TaxID=7962 RepID=A0A8C2CSD2_CYPCA
MLLHCGSVKKKKNRSDVIRPIASLPGLSIMASMQKRLQKELLALQSDPPPGMTLNERSVQNTITEWLIDMEGAPGTLYEGEKFQLLFKFSSRYPFDSPQVMFTGENIPVHPHVYSNGHICLSILTEDWSPALSVQSVCLSIISMLSSCKEKRRPPDNSFYVKTCNKNPKKTKWWYHGECIPLSSIKRLLKRVILVSDQSSNHFVCFALSAC